MTPKHQQYQSRKEAGSAAGSDDAHFPLLQKHPNSVTFWLLMQGITVNQEADAVNIDCGEKGAEEKIVFSGTGSSVWNPVLSTEVVVAPSSYGWWEEAHYDFWYS